MKTTSATTVALAIVLSGALAQAHAQEHAHSAQASHSGQPAGNAHDAAAKDTPAHAHGATGHSKMDHSKMNHSKMDHSKMDHSKMDHSKMDHSKVDHAAMGHAATPQAGAKPAPDHVPPPPPAHEMGDMSYAEMVDVMGMDDRAKVGMVSLERLEYVEGGAKAWSAQAWYGGDFNKFRLRTEGRHADGEIEHADVELLWSHALAPFWDSQVGIRQDFGRGPDRTWAAFGVQGLAPYWFELSATAYVGAQGRTALRVESDYELLLTQRLVLQPRLELNAYGKDDHAAGIGSGLADAGFGVRLRYEIRREFAPYVGVEWRRSFGETADLARADGHDASDMQWVVGVRAWF